ncbi:hypothetical protein UFOVP328_431 [uncultured Caudovirales phage]|uniref:Uncharacterized protein n=1 Tax=uncultured Caudovirales phage TaxID=2100421 RepID=A0A6J5LUX1_9CAUD|nr:hypothetical protein UFOVP328_431 [uncultured Caudovirales phage]
MSTNLTPFSSDGGFSTTGNVVAENVLVTASIGVSGVASPAPTISGFGSINSVNFNASGNISLGGGRINGGTATVVQDGINSIALAPGATMDLFGFPFTTTPTRGRLTISGDISTTEALGTWYYQSVNNNYTYQLYTDSTYTTLVDASGWTPYTGGGIVDITLQSPPANIVINSNGFTSTFDNTGDLTLPGSLSVVGGTISLTGEGVLRSIDDTVTLLSLNTSTGNANSVYLGSSGGLGFNDQEAGGNWLEIFRNGAEPQITVPVGRGNLYIQTSQGETPYNWTFGNTGNLSAPGNVSAVGNITGGNLTVGSGTITGGNVNGAIFNGNVAFGTGTVGGSGNITGGNISAIGNITGNIAGFAIGYRDIPQVSFTGNATIATTDAGKHFYSTQSSNFTLTIANNSSQGFQVGAAITVVNQGTGTITIAQGSGVILYLAGNATAGNRSVSTFGMATIMKVATNTWFINGTGVS